MFKLSHARGLRTSWKSIFTVVLLGASFALPAIAQVRISSSDKVIFPVGLKWERMRTVILDSSAATKESPMVPVRKDDITASKRIWKDEVATLAANGQPTDFNSQISTAAYKGTNVAFSLIALPLDFERCEQALNGKNVVDVYAKCLARVAIGDMRNPHLVEFSGFCYADSIFATPEELQFRAKTHNDFAFDEKSGIAYFRLVQHGRLVPACNRMIKLEGI